MRRLLLLLLSSIALTGINAQTHPIEIHSNNRVASLLMTMQEYEDWKTNDEYNNQAVREALFQDIYQKFNDEFDFIFLILNEDERPDNLPFGQLIQVSNDIAGIGLNPFDNSQNYGSDGELEAVIHLTRRNYLRSGPSLHELMHNWGNFGILTESVAAPGNGLMSFPFRPHWGFTGGSSRGQIGGFEQSTLVDNGGGSYTVDAFGPNANGGNSVPFSEMELYLMGMLPLANVSDFDAFSDITSLTINANDFDFEASSKTTYTPASIEALLGARVPASDSAQKDFKALIIVLTDTPLTTAEWDQVDDDAEKFSRTESDGSSSYNFWEATNEMGTINFEIDCNATGTDVQTSCDSLVWIDGMTYTSSNDTATHTITGGAANGCDSVVTLDLTINHSKTGVDVQTACDSYLWIDGNLYQADNNTAMFTISGGAANGCDSVVTLDLTILNSVSGVDVQTACDAFIWIDGNTYTSDNNSAMVTLMGAAANGCDSTVTLNLTIISVDTAVTISGPTITANQAGLEYQWLDCDNNYAVIDGETGQSFTADANGNYAVQLTKEFCVDTSECVPVNITSVNGVFAEDQLSVYPNPANNRITITILSNHVYLKEVTLLNSLGQVMFGKKTDEYQRVLSIDVSRYSSGIYFMRIKNSENQLSIRRVVVN